MSVDFDGTFARHLLSADAERQQAVIEEARRLGWYVIELGRNHVDLKMGTHEVTIRTVFAIAAVDLGNVLTEAEE